MGLSTRVTLLTFVSVTAAVALVSVISLVGVYRSSLSQEMTRLDAFRTLIAGSLDARFSSAERSVDSLASELGTPTVSDVPGAVKLDRLMEPHADVLDALAYLDAHGLVASSVEVTSAPRGITAALAAAKPGAPVLAWEPSPDAISGRLWVGRAAGEGTRTAMVLGRVRDTYLSRTLDDVALAKGALTALVVDREGWPVLAGGGVRAANLNDIVFSQDGTSGVRGTVTASSPGVGGLTGSWERIIPDRGLGWRVLVLEANSDALARAGSALVPAMLAMLAVVIFAVLSALLFSRRLLTPLKGLEQRARDVAAGGYIRPLRVVRDDEMGRVAEAFNEMGVRLNSLQDMAQLLASASNLDDVLDAVLSALGRILGTGDAAVLLSDPSGLALSLVRGRGLAEHSATLLVSFDEPSPFVQAFVEQRAVAFSGDQPPGADSIYRLFGADTDRAGVAVPLAIGHEAIGVVVVLAPGRRVFTEAQIETLRVFSANAAVAVRTSRLFADERLSRTEAEALRSVAELTVRPGDLGHALDNAAAVAAELLGYRGWACLPTWRRTPGCSGSGASSKRRARNSRRPRTPRSSSTTCGIAPTSSH
jgi:HAMP domain-containing protein